ncbi:MAG: LamG domain-containing protein [Planctomycetota bacterium]
MFRRFICMVTLTLVLGIAGNTLADLIDHWRLDEGSGETAINSVAGGVDGTINGATWANEPPHGVVLSFDGVDDVVTMVGYKAITGGASRSMCLWFKTDGAGTGPNGRGLIGWGTPQGAGVRWELAINMQGDPRVPGALRINASSGTRTCQTVVTDSQWHHVAVTLHDDGSPTSEEMYVYLDGVEESYSQTNAGVAINTGSDADVRIGNGVRENQNGFFSGLIDDVRIYDHALTEAEILAIMAGGTGGYPFALSPDPADGALIEATWASLSWSAGDFAVSHDLYIGDSFDDVNDGAEATFVGNLGKTSQVVGFPGFPVPEGLQPGTTYYWRVDEVNDADPNSPWKGDIWSFSIPPKTAYNPDPADGAQFVDPNGIFTWTGGYGSKLHTVYLGDNYDEVYNAGGGVPMGTSSYDPGTLDREKVLYWRVDEFDGAETYKGDVWSFTTPGAVGNPQPANGIVDVQMTETLSWTAADNAASHELYFGTEADAVNNATTASPEYIGPRALGGESYDPGRLAWDSSYAWRVDEVYATGTVKGLVWTFATADFILVDDFESYNDIDPPDPNSNRIFDKWIDGYGTTTNGALVGNDLPPYAETTIVHGGAQSMVYRYDNAGKTSEATLTLVYPSDWTEEGVTGLSLWFRGASANAADRMFVALNGESTVYHDDLNATQMTGWNHWVIDLQAFAGVDLSNVNTIAVGFGTKGAPAAGGAGTMYVDDIRLIRIVD